MPIASDEAILSPKRVVDCEDGGEGFAISQVVNQEAPSTQPPSNGVPEYAESSEDESEDEGPPPEDVVEIEAPIHAILATWTFA